jgi:MFS family permease
LNQQKTLSSTGSGFFYGYVIVAASFIILLVSWGSQYSFGVFLKPMLDDFGWTRAATSGAYSLNMILTGVFGILAGRLADRFSPRLVLSICGALIGLGYFLLSRVGAIWQLYLVYGVLISLGVSGMYVPLLSTVARWFIKKRGLASGIVVSGIGIGVVIIPPLANLLISNYSWRTSFAIIGFVSLGLIVLIAQFLRHPSGQKAPAARDTGTLNKFSPNLQVQGLSFKEAIRTRQFLIISVMYALFGFGQYTIMIHIVAHATDIGVSAAAAAIILSVIGLVSVASKVSMGTLGDRIGNSNIMIIVFAATSLTFIWLIISNQLWMLYLFGAIFGLGYGGFVTMQSPLVADYFGLKAHGAIYGVVMFVVSIGGSVGPLIAGSIFDNSGSYNWAFILCAVLGLFGFVLAVLLKRLTTKIRAISEIDRRP